MFVLMMEHGIIFGETSEVYLRQIGLEDVAGMYELDADPLVHRFLGNRPITTMEQAREGVLHIMDQYKRHGIGRWAIVAKGTEELVGWCGLKLVEEEVNGYQQFYDLGYRIKPRFWGKGIATATSRIAMAYAFETLNVETLYARTLVEHTASARVLAKLGFERKESFEFAGLLHHWYALTKAAWKD